MKLAIIHPYQFRLKRGIERFTWSLSGALIERGVQIDLLTWRWPQQVSWGTLPPNLQARQVPSVRYFASRFAIPYYVNWLRSGHYDWVMLFFAGYGEAEAMRLLHILHPQRYCVVFHFPREEVPHRYEEFHRFDLAAKADRRIAVSDFVARGVEDEYKASCDVVHNGVNPVEFSPSADKRTQSRQLLNIADSSPVLVTMAALEERKGIQWVIRALPNLLAGHPDLHYYILGEGPYRATLETEVQQLRLTDHVHLVGSTDDVVSYLAAADIGCLLSHGEAFPITLVEYMAMELPVLTSQHPPFGDLVAPSFGVCVDEQDSQQVSAAIDRLLLDTTLRRSMGESGRAEVLQKYTWSKIADDYLRVLKS